mgnify:CR=1 FL=1
MEEKETELKKSKKELLFLQEEYIKLQKSCNRKKRIIDNNIAIENKKNFIIEK